MRRLQIGKGGFLKSVLILVGGNAAAQVISFISAPVLSRLYAPADYGVSTMFFSIITTVSVFAMGKYEMGLVLPKEDTEAVDLFNLCAILLVSSAAIASVALFLTKDSLAALLHLDLPSWAYAIIPLSLLLIGFNTLLGNFATRFKEFKAIASRKVSQSVFGFLVNLSGGLLGWGGVGLIIGNTVGQSAGFVSLWRLTRARTKDLHHRSRRSELAKVAREYKKFPLFNVASSFFNVFSWQLPAFMLGAFFDSGVVGYYGMGFRLVQLPISLLSSALAQVFFERAARAKRDGSMEELAAVTKRIYPLLFFYAALPVAFLGGLGREAVTFFLGASWATSARYLQILLPWIFVWALSSPLSSLLVVLNRQGTGLILNIVIFATRFLSLYIGGRSQRVELALGLFSATGVVTYGWLAVWILLRSGLSLRWLLAGTARFSLPLAGFGLCAYVLHRALPAGSIWVLICGTVIFLITTLIALLSVPDFRVLVSKGGLKAYFGAGYEKGQENT